MTTQWRYCPQCAHELAPATQDEDGGPKERLRCANCGFTHWNNPTPVLAAIVECADRDGKVLLARNAAWSGRMFALITGFMEETALTVDSVKLVGVWDFQRMNQVIVAYHVVARGEIVLSPELAEYKLFAPGDIVCWPAGTGYAVAEWLRGRGIEPRFMSFEERAALSEPRPDAS